MAKTDNLTDFLTDVASAIRTKTGTQALINPQDFSSEIAGIPTGGEDFTLADATPADVTSGKTFYAGNATLKTGTNQLAKEMKSLIWFQGSTTTQPDRISISMPSDVTYLHSYFAWNNYNPVDFYFNPNITIVPNYAFYSAKKFTFPNFTSLTNLTILESYSFYNSNKNAFDFQTWPSNLQVIESRAFQETIKAGVDLVLPNTLERMGMYALCTTASRLNINSISIPHYNHYLLPQGLFYYISANCDFTPNSCVTTIGSQFNYRGSFNNVTIPTTCTKLENYAFGAQSTDAISNFHMSTMTFLSTTPPAFGTDVIATQHLQSGFKIYVPDTAVSAYQSASNFSRYSSYIVGESTRPTYNITVNLTNCTGDNSATSLAFGHTYKNKITPDEGYTLEGATVSITMGGTEYASSTYAAGRPYWLNQNGEYYVSANSLLGDTVITITAVPET